MKTFPTKVDAWILALMIVGLGSPFAIIFAVMSKEPQAIAGLYICVPMILGIAAMIYVISWPTNYTVGEGNLIVKSGKLVNKTVAIETIVEIYPTRNPLSSPAWSLDRLGINCTKNGEGSHLVVLISPADKDGFFAAVAAEDRALHFDGERLIRQP